MTIQEVCQELRADCKPYALVKMKRQYFSCMVRRIEANTCKLPTIEKFFNRMGYVGSFNSWERCEVPNS